MAALDLNPADYGKFQPLMDALSGAIDITQPTPAPKKAGGSNGPSAALASGGGGGMDDLLDRLEAAMKGPEAEVGKDLVPSTPDVGVLPEKDPNADPASEAEQMRKALENFDHLRDIAAIADLFIAITNASKRAKRGHPEEYRISVPKEAAQAFADMADSSYSVMSGPLAGMYSFASGTQNTFSRRMSKTELHLGFLAEIFKGFNLTDVATQQLDGILTNFIKSLGDISVSTESTNNTVDQTIRIHQTLAINISGSASRPIWVYQPRTRIVYMHVDSSTWSWATNKANHTQSTFNMQYVVVDFDLNVNKWLASKPALEQIFKETSGATLKEYGKLRFPAPVDPSAKK